nr:hypothetical protein [Saprospiraceae bacterium]
MLRRRKYTISLILFLVTLLAASFLPIDIPYTIKSKALLLPAKEWELSRLVDGSLSSIVRNQLTGAIESYGVTEFRRGDVVSFEINPEVYASGKVSKGDTIGLLYSNDEQMRLAELKGEVDVLNAEIAFYLTGEKSEFVKSMEKEVAVATEAVARAETIYNRSKRMMKDTLIPIEEFEIDRHEFELRKLELEHALAKLEVVKTGDKPERIDHVRAQRDALKNQIHQLENRMEQLTLLAPIDGMVSLDRNYLASDILVKVIDTSSYVGVAPVLLRDRPYISSGNEVRIRAEFNGSEITGEVYDFNNVSELLNGKAVVFFTFKFDSSDREVQSGKMIEIEVRGTPLNPQQYAMKLFRSPI